MRLLVHGASLGDGDRRLRDAVAGLGMRGHEVAWTGPGMPQVPGAVVAVSPRDTWVRGTFDLVLGGNRPFAVARTAWLARSHGMLLSASPDDIARWGWRDRWAWESLRAAAIAEAEAGSEDDPAVPRVRWTSEPSPEVPEVVHPDVDVLERACEREIARHRGAAARPAVFLDRDGTLVVEKGYLSHAEDLEVFPAAAPALVRLAAAGYALVVVSNQSGVGRGFFPLGRVHEAMARLRRVLRAAGVELDAIYFCPHRPEAGCDCRKPGGALLRQAAANLRLALKRSAMTGDKLIDVATGHRVGAAGILVRTGYGSDEEQRAGTQGARPPDLIADDLGVVATWLVARAEAHD